MDLIRKAGVTRVALVTVPMRDPPGRRDERRPRLRVVVAFRGSLAPRALGRRIDRGPRRLLAAVLIIPATRARRRRSRTR
jgi:hypothetical protein